MSEVATAELGLALVVADDNDSDNFDVFSSLRDGAGGEDFSSGVDEGRGADTDENVCPILRLSKIVSIIFTQFLESVL